MISTYHGKDVDADEVHRFQDVFTKERIPSSRHQSGPHWPLVTLSNDHRDVQLARNSYSK